MDSAVKPVQNGRSDGGTPNRSWRCCRSAGAVVDRTLQPGGPHSALGMQQPAECYATWLFKNKTRSVHN